MEGGGGARLAGVRCIIGRGVGDAAPYGGGARGAGKRRGEVTPPYGWGADGAAGIGGLVRCALYGRKETPGASLLQYTSTDHWVSPQKARRQLAAANSLVPMP